MKLFFFCCVCFSHISNNTKKTDGKQIQSVSVGTGAGGFIRSRPTTRGFILYGRGDEIEFARESDAATYSQFSVERRNIRLVELFALELCSLIDHLHHTQKTDDWLRELGHTARRELVRWKSAALSILSHSNDEASAQFISAKRAYQHSRSRALLAQLERCLLPC